MIKKILLKRGTSENTAAYTGKIREVTEDTDKKTLIVHDGGTAGGTPAAKLADVPTKLSQLTLDSGLWTKNALALAALTDDVGYWKRSDLTKTSQLANDNGYKTGHCAYCSHCTYCSNCGRCNNVKCSQVQCGQVQCNQVQCSQCSGYCTNCSSQCSKCSQCDCCDN